MVLKATITEKEITKVIQFAWNNTVLYLKIAETFGARVYTITDRPEGSVGETVFLFNGVSSSGVSCGNVTINNDFRINFPLGEFKTRFIPSEKGTNIIEQQREFLIKNEEYIEKLREILDYIEKLEEEKKKESCKFASPSISTVEHDD